MNDPLDRKALDRMAAIGCQNPDCKNPKCHEEVFIVPRCHPKGRLDARYDAINGVLELRCGTCEKTICYIQPKED